MVTGTFAIDAEPRVDPLLTVTFATANANRQVTQFIAGPFDLGRPHGCPPTSRSGKTRIPQSDEESTLHQQGSAQGTSSAQRSRGRPGSASE